MKTIITVLILCVAAVCQSDRLILTPAEVAQVRAHVKKSVGTNKHADVSHVPSISEIYVKRHLPFSEFILCDGPQSENCKDVKVGTMALRRGWNK